MPTLSERDAKIAQLLASGVTQSDAARQIGVSRATVTRLIRSEDFQAEVERRRNNQFYLANNDDEVPDLEYEWDSDITEHIGNMEKIADTFFKIGMSGAIKAAKRIKDLPEEALRASDAIALLKASKECLEFSFDTSAEMWGIHELAEQKLKERG